MREGGEGWRKGGREGKRDVDNNYRPHTNPQNRLTDKVEELNAELDDMLEVHASKGW